MKNQHAEKHNNMKIERIMKLWEQATDLNYGQMMEVVAAAEKAATDKLHQIRKAKFKAAKK